MKKFGFYLVLILVVLTGCSTYRSIKFYNKYGPMQTVDRRILSPTPGEVSFYDDVEPILENRCAVCHSCFDAPCQFKLTCPEGIERGGSKLLVYDATRLTSIKPTRLFTDAVSVKQWRKKGFYPVLNERDQTFDAHTDNSLVHLMLQLKRDHPQPEEELLPGSFDIDPNRKKICTTTEDFSKYKKKYPLWGMPFALPGLTGEEFDIIDTWIKQGAKIPVEPEIPGETKEIIARWEDFFNRDTIKQQLVSRYIYEHLFIAHIYFDSLPDREFYQMVRSATPPGEPVVELDTERPYDDPGVERFYYRFRKAEKVVALKNHIAYRLSPEKMARYQELFFDVDYEVEQLPSYDPKISANPFKTFVDLPAKSRYQFMLDDALYMTMAIIKGPSCRGQIALNVINDHFFLAFIDPDKDPAVNNAEYLASVSDYLVLPTERRSKINVSSIYYRYNRNREKYIEARENYLETLDPDNHGFDIGSIWDGDGTNDNALLTIFRHFDTGTVVKGFVGQVPKTAWVVDYPVFERIFYLLVPGFNVFGNVTHQMTSRIYTDFIRREGENNFLIFLPKKERKKLRGMWYQGLLAEYQNHVINPLHGLKRSTKIVYTTDDPKREFIEKILHYVGPRVAGPPDHLNRCFEKECMDDKISSIRQKVELELRKITQIKGPQVQLLPDLAFLHLAADNEDDDMAYTIIRNKALSNNSFLFREGKRRRIEDDYLTIVRGHLGAYPNVFGSIPVDRLDEFVEKYLHAKDLVSYYMFIRQFAVGRTYENFWVESDWHYKKALEERPIDGGLFDMISFNRIVEKVDSTIEW